MAQIKQAAGQSSNDDFSGVVDYTKAPWFDWGPYLWADGETARNFDGLRWCGGQNDNLCQSNYDIRWGNPNDGTQWGDFTHPSALGAQKVANMLVKFFTKTVPNGGSPFVQHWNQQ